MIIIVNIHAVQRKFTYSFVTKCHTMLHGLSNLCARKTEDHVLTFNSAIPNVSCLIFLHLMIKTVWFNLIYN